jgi:16S rRNA (guanine527-N7)-methyltransferase
VPATDPGAQAPSPLLDILGQARQAGFLGPGAVEPHLAHAQGFVAVARREAAAGSAASSPRLLDLGSGGGLPGLVVALEWPEATVVLLDANRRRTEFLARAVSRLGLADRVSVVHDRAESAGRDPGLRGAMDGVVVRSFGPPAVVAECAAPFLRPGGWLIVSEPPGAAGGAEETPSAGGAPGGSRWPREPLSQFGLAPGEFVQGEFGYQILWQRELCPERFPRRNGVPAKSPLF